MTQDEFNEMFLQAMSTYGRAIESDTEIPVVDPSGMTDSELSLYSLPMVKDEDGQLSYAKAKMNDFVTLMSNVYTKAEVDAMIEELRNLIQE